MVARLKDFDVADYFDDMLELVESARTAMEDGSPEDEHGALDSLTGLVTLILQDAGVDVPGAPEPSDSCEDSI